MHIGLRFKQPFWKVILSTLLTAALQFSASAHALDTSCDRIAEGNRAAFPNSEVERRWKKSFDEVIVPYYADRLSEQLKNTRLIAAMWQLKISGSPVAYLLEYLGFEITATSFRAPPLDVFISKYEQYLDENRIPEEKRIRPALSYANKNNNVVLKIPFHDEAPDPSLWEPTKAPRLEAKAMAENLVAGRFPLFADGVHDIFHLIIFALHPEYAHQLRTKSRDLLASRFTGPVRIRMGYALETLSVADSSKLEEIRNVIAIKDCTSETTYEKFKNAIDGLTNEELFHRADYWIANFQRFLIHFGSGVLNPEERNYYGFTIRMSPLFLREFTGDYSKSKSTGSTLKMEEMIAHADTVLDLLLKLNALAYSEISDQPTNLKMALIRQQVTRMEYFLWRSANSVSARQWLEDTLKPTVDINSPTMRLIRDTFGANSLNYQKMTAEINPTADSELTDSN